MEAALDDPRWPLVLERLEAKEMPSRKAKKFPSASARQQVVGWFRALRAYDIAQNAGDPGIVLARRLSNAEFNYTVRDLTGADIRPTREFPIDPTNTAGFDNSGESLTMSPALVKKYLGAARDIVGHMFLRPDGFSFAPHSMLSDTDRDKYCVQRIIAFYHQQKTDYLDYFEAAWRYKHRVALGRPDATLASTAAAAAVSPKYLSTLWSVFEGERETLGPVARVQALWRALPEPGPNGSDTAGQGRAALRDFIVGLRKKIEPRFLNLAAGGVNTAQQPLLIWKNVQYATHRMTFDRAQLQVEGEPAPPAFVGPEPGATSAFGPGRTQMIVNTPGDLDLRVPAGQRAAYEAAFGKFSRVFPDMFYMQASSSTISATPIRASPASKSCAEGIFLWAGSRLLLARLSECYESKSLGSRRVVEAFVECRKGNPLARFSLQVQTAGELDRISGSQRVLQEEGLGIPGQFWS